MTYDPDKFNMSNFFNGNIYDKILCQSSLKIVFKLDHKQKWE